MAAGGPVEPYWNLYAVHKDPEVLPVLSPSFPPSPPSLAPPVILSCYFVHIIVVPIY